jgi:hypothetical protein
MRAVASRMESPLVWATVSSRSPESVPAEHLHIIAT